MNILMMTNSYLPRIDGVANSVKAFMNLYREMGHRTIIVAPEYENQNEDENDVIRLPSIQHYSNIDYSVVLPIPGYLDSKLKDFSPDIIHSHHPFLIGSTAQRLSARLKIPLVFTHHTRYELYTHYTPLESLNMKEFIISLSSGYENLCDCVIAPSNSIKDILLERKVTSRIEVIPTGVDADRFTAGNGKAIREKFGIKDDTFLFGYVGRVAKEKNLAMLARAALEFMRRTENTSFLLVGDGPVKPYLQRLFINKGLSERVIFTDSLTGDDLINAYNAIDAFVFCSKTETQGMVITEAMSAGVPVVALDATGISDVLRDGQNGYLVKNENKDEFADALEKLKNLDGKKQHKMKKHARKTAEEFSIENSVKKMLAVYKDVITGFRKDTEKDESFWEKALKQIKAELSMFNNAVKAVEKGLSGK